MVTLEQIKLLESKITKAVNFVAQLTDENNYLKKRNEELDEAIAALREEKTRVQEGIISALGKLNQFEDAIERSLSSVKGAPKPRQNGPAQKVDAAAPVQLHPVSPRPISPVPQPAPVPAEKPEPGMPSAYTVDEEPEETSETELDIF